MYILQCHDQTLYTGSTIDLERRLILHQSGKGAKYTRQRLPVELVYWEEYTLIKEAFSREKQVQSWTRKKKIALIEGECTDFPEEVKKVFRKQ